MAGISSGLREPLPTRRKVPTRLRTMWCKNPLPRIVKVNSSSVLAHSEKMHGSYVPHFFGHSIGAILFIDFQTLRSDLGQNVFQFFARHRHGADTSLLATRGL